MTAGSSKPSFPISCRIASHCRIRVISWPDPITEIAAHFRKVSAKCGYNGLVADIPKVPKAQFEAVLRSLLNAAPMPMADIPRSRESKAKAKRSKKQA